MAVNAQPSQAREAEYPYKLGSYSRKITTNSTDAQVWFDRGLTWLFGFNLEEATVCFQQALGYDHECPMAAWGLAYALGPHYNFQWASRGDEARAATVQRTYDAARRAQEIALVHDQITPVEAAFVKAIQARYPVRESPSKLEDFADWNRGYADAMQVVYEQFPGDAEVATFYADSMLNLTPWRIWDTETGQPTTGSRAIQTKEVLEKALKQPGGHRHAGLLHMYIHLMEMSPLPEQAVPVANNLRDLVPDCGHLQHMASHIDVLVGSYDLATKSNQDAVAVDEQYLSRNHLSFYTNYALHNLTSLIFAAMMAGNSKAAFEGCDRLEEVVTEPFLRLKEPNMADFAESFCATRPHVLIRFGRWQDILALPFPSDADLYTVTISVLHYAKGIAHAALGNIEQAEEHRRLFQPAFARVTGAKLNFPNKSRDVLEVARSMLDGELEYRKGNYDLAFQRLSEATASEDRLMYAEPPGWMLPTRHAAAALLLEQGHVRRAGELYAEDLGVHFDGKEAQLPRPRRHPRNLWALHGLHECLVRLGMTDDAKLIEQELDIAKRGADIKISSSCFCRIAGVDVVPG